MNAHETAAVLALMGAAYPTANVSEQTAMVWAENLIGVVPDVGLEAARNLIRTSKWFPSVAEFIEQVAAVKRARLPEQRALPPGRLSHDPETHRRMIAACREVVAQAKASGVNHWHGGPDRCPVCARNRQPQEAF